MDNIPLVLGLKKYIQEQNAPFSMPGHKYGRGFKNEVMEVPLEELISWDMTEVDGLDNLHNPEEIIKEGQERLKELYRSNKSYFLVNGSTCGNLVMMFSSFKEGDEVLVERNCHRSISNGIIMRKLKPIYIKNIYSENLKEAIGMDVDDLKEKLKSNTNIKGIVLTYPNYYGIGVNIKEIIRICKERKLKVLIDSAHGAHFGFHELLPENAQSLGGDMVVMSAHKTLPSLTQTAYLHVNNSELVERVEFYLGVFMSTSPSYIFMASLDYARAFLEYKGQESYGQLIERVKDFKNEVKKLQYVKVLEKQHFIEEGFENINMDTSRIILNTNSGYSGHKLLEYLRKNRVQCEMSSSRAVVLIPSPFNIEQDFKLLIDALKQCKYNKLVDEEVPMMIEGIPNLKLMPYEVMEGEKIFINLNDTLGKIVAENIIPYPPGVPLLVMGEEVEKEHIRAIQRCLDNRVTVLGVKNSKIKVLK